MSLDVRRAGVLGFAFFLGLATTLSVGAAGQESVRSNADPSGSSDALAVGRVLVDRLDFARFQENVGNLAGFGTRYWNTEGNAEARDWIAEQLESYGYDVERHTFVATGRPEGSVEPTQVDNVYVTKIGTRYPDRMFIVSAHMDSFNTESEDQSFAPGANDDGSGTSIVLEAARVFASTDIRDRVFHPFHLLERRRDRAWSDPKPMRWNGENYRGGSSLPVRVLTPSRGGWVSSSTT